MIMAMTSKRSISSMAEFVSLSKKRQKKNITTGNKSRENSFNRLNSSVIPHHTMATKIVRKQNSNYTCTEYLVMLLFSIFLGIYVGSEVGYGSYIDTFCTEYNSITCSSSTGRYMTSMFWGSLSFGRLCSVLLIKHITPSTMLIWDLIGCMIACVVFILFSDDILYVWIATGIYGFSMASPFPAIFLLAENTVTVTGKLASFMVFGASVGEFVIPYVQGTVMDNIGIATFIGVTFVTSAAMIVVLFAILCTKQRLPTT